MKRFIALVALLALFAGLSFGASVSLLEVSRIDIEPTVAVDADGQVVYAGLGGALNIYNIYQRDFPQLMGTIEGHSSNIKSIVVQGRRLFVLWEKEGLEIYDITDRYLPVFLGRFSSDNDERFKRFTALDLDGQTAYIGGENYIASVDVSQPLSPMLLNYASLNCAPMKIDFHRNKLYIAAGKLGLGAMFVPNPKYFQFIGSQHGIYTTVKGYKDLIFYGRLDEPKPSEQTIFGKHLFSFPFKSPTVVKITDDVIYAGGLANFAIYNIPENSSNPQLIWNLPNMPTLDCVLHDKIAYLANSYKGLSAFDVTDIHNPVEIGRLETFDVPRRASVIGDKLYVAAGLSGVVVFDVSAPEYPEFIGRLAADKLHTVWDVKRFAKDIYVLGARDDFMNNIFVERYDADGNWLAEYPIARVDNFDPIGELAFGDKYCAISLGREGIVLMHNNDGELEAGYSLRDAAVQFCDMEIRGGMLYASDYHGGYHIYRIDSGMPYLAGFVQTSTDGGNGIVLKDKYLLAADGPEGLAVIDIGEPKYPKKIANYPTVWGTDIAVSGDYAFLSDGQGACKVFDISHLPDVEQVAELPDNGYWMHIYADDNMIYGIDQFFGVYIYELRTEEGTLSKNVPAKPDQTTIVQAYPNPFNAETSISFSLADKTDAELSIFDATGRKVSTLLADKLPAGKYTMKWNAENSPSGTYFAILKTPDKQVEQKLTLVK